MTALQLLAHGDGVSRAVAALLAAMSVASWVTILWKAWLLRGGTRAVLRGIAAFWQAPTLADAERGLAAFDASRWISPTVLALREFAARAQRPSMDVDSTSLGMAGGHDARLTRTLRDALHTVLRRLQAGQILLATVGATAPFVGLLGTVWGIRGALAGMGAAGGGLTIDDVAGPVGEALVMTALGLAVALPAVLAYNVFGRFIGRIEAELEGFAHDLLDVFGQPKPMAAPLPPARPMPV